MQAEVRRNAIYEQLEEITQLQQAPGEDPTLYVKRLIAAASNAMNAVPEGPNGENEVYDSLTKDAQTWFNNTVRAINEETAETVEAPQEAPREERVRLSESQVAEDNAALAEQLRALNPPTTRTPRPWDSNMAAAKAVAEETIAEGAKVAEPAKVKSRGRPRTTKLVATQANGQDAVTITGTPAVGIAEVWNALTLDEVAFIKALYKVLRSHSLFPAPDVKAHVSAPQPTTVTTVQLPALAHASRTSHASHTSHKTIKSKHKKDARGRKTLWADNAVIKILVPPRESKLRQGSAQQKTYQKLVKLAGEPWSKAEKAGVDRRQAYYLDRNEYIELR